MRLTDRGFPEPIIDEVIQTLQAQRLLSEARAVEAFVESRSGAKAKGRDRVREELIARGASESALPDRSDEEERVIMLNLIAKSEDRAKAGRMLASRGFSEDLIESVLDQRFGGWD